MRDVLIEQLRREEARELTVRLLGDRPATEAEISAIVDDTHGHPQFIDELVRHRASHATAPVTRLDDALWARVMDLNPTARRLLELVAIAGTPITQEIAADAAAIDMAQLFQSGAILRAANFVKTSGAGKDDLIETYHNRVRESVAAHVDRELARKWHGRLAAALERVESADAEALATHWEGAGNRARAAEYAERAADDAATALAFERAARLYRRALDLGGDARDRRDVQRRLVEALMGGGYIADAAEVQLELARTATGDVALDLKRRAAENLLCSGHFARGIDLLRSVLRTFGVHFPTRPLDVIVSLLLLRFVLWLRGLSFRERDAAAISPHARVKIDAVSSAGAGFAMSDNIRGAYFQTRNLLSALNVGDLPRIVRALGMEVCFRAAGGSATREATRRLLERERELCLRVGTPLTLAYLHTATAYAKFMVGEWREAVTSFTAAEDLYRDRCVGVAFELSSLRILLYRSLGYLGDVDALVARVPDALRDAERQGDMHAMTNYQTGPMVLLGLAADEPDRVAAEIARATARLAPGAFLIQHYFTMMGECQLDLYQRDPAAAHARISAAWPSLARSLLLRVQLIRLGALEQRARCAIGAACVTPDRARRDALLHAAEKDARRIAREPLAWANAQATMTRASIAAARDARDERDAAKAGFDAAARLFEEIGMVLYAAACTRRSGELREGLEAQRRLDASDGSFAAQHVRDAARFSATLIASVPGRGASAARAAA